MFKAGQKVILSPRHGPDQVRVVERVTKTQAIVGKSKFRQSNGSEVGADGWFFAMIRPASDAETAEIEETYRRAVLAARFSHLNWSDYSLDTLREVQRILDQAHKAVAAQDAK